MDALGTSGRRSAASCLKEGKARIYREWERRVRGALPAAQGKSDYLLKDSLPQFLDAMVASLEQNYPKSVDITEVSKGHAMQRAGVGDYDLEQVLAEYNILREVVFSALDEGADLDVRDRNIILDLFNKGTTTAAKIYAEQTIQRETQISHALKETEVRLSLAVESAKLGVWDYDLRTGSLNWSERLKELWNYGPGEFPGTIEGFWARIHPEDRDRVAEALRNAAERGLRYDIEYRVVWPDGSIHWISAQGVPTTDLVGKVTRLAGVGLEITDRVEAERRLRNSEEFFRLASRATQDLLWDWDLRSNTIRWNEEVAPRLGYPLLENATSATWWYEHIHPEDCDRVISGVREVIDSGKSHWVDRYRFRHSSGKYLHFVDRGFVSRGPDGRAVRMVGAMQDVTQFKEVETALRTSEAKFRLLYDSALIGIAFGDVAGGLYEMNDYFVNLLGYTREEVKVMGLNWVNLTPPEYLYLDERAIGEMNEQGRCSPYEKPFVRKDGSWVWATVIAIYLDKEKFRHVGIVIDVTEKRRALESLEESERELRLVTESVPQFIWVAEPNGASGRYNQNWYRYTGLSPQTAQSFRWEEFVHPDDLPRTRANWVEAQATGVYSNEYRLKRHDGVYRWFLTRAKPHKDEIGRIIRWYGTTTDIHDQKVALEKLEQERELREQFVATLTHDLRTPLTAAKMSAQMLMRRGDDPAILRKAAVKISENVDRADHMIRDLLDANRIKAGERLPVQVTDCDLTEIAEETIEELAIVHGDRFVLSIPERLEGRWSCEGVRRILENLCTNAIKYGSKDRPVSVLASRNGDCVRISVHNFGTPIPEAEQKALFEPFRRSASAQAGTQKGWGLGLTLVRGIAEAHGGAVSVESMPEKGTTFWVDLPVDASG